MPAKRRQALLDVAHHAVLAHEVIDDDDDPAGPADAAHLGGKARRVRHHRGDIKRQHRVEGVVLEGQVFGVHLDERLDLRQVLARDPPARPRQHLGRDVDAGHRGIGTEIRQRQAGADADLEDALARPVIGDADRILAAGMEHRAEDQIIGPREQAIGPDVSCKSMLDPL